MSHIAWYPKYTVSGEEAGHGKDRMTFLHRQHVKLSSHGEAKSYVAKI